jgi:hypothetical protein
LFQRNHLRLKGLSPRIFFGIEIATSESSFDSYGGIK